MTIMMVKKRSRNLKIKDKLNDTGQGRDEWMYFDAMDQIMGHKKLCTVPESVEWRKVLARNKSDQEGLRNSK